MPTSPTGKTSRRGGFTLVELSLVALLIAALAAVAAPAFAAFWRANQVRTCAWQIAALARRARDAAIGREVPAALLYDAQERVFRLAAETDPEGAPGVFEPLSLAGAQPVRVPEPVAGVRVTVEGREADDDWLVVFFPDGQALESEIALEGPSGETWQVNIAPLTGGARVVVGDEDAER